MTLTEDELFGAYRTGDGYRADCACGGEIVSQLGSDVAVQGAIALHQESPLHQQWREWQEAVHALQRPTKRACPCHGVGG